MLITELNLSRKGAFSDKTKPLTDFGDINIFLGHNGTGKTTISREIANATTQNQVFNSDYIKLNIQQNLSGVVVIGHENIELKNQKDKLEGEKSKIINELTEKQKLLEDTKIKLEKTIQQLHNEVWSHVVDYKKDDRWINYFRPNWSNKSSMYQFYCEKRPKGEVSITYTDLENRQKSLFSKNLQLRALITLPIPPSLSEEDFNILDKVIVGGSEKSSFSAFIDKLNNGDWIHRGLSYLDASVDICPFCQSKISDKIISEIKNYFNKEYQSDITTLNHLYNNFTIYVKEYAEDLNSINKNYSEFLKNTQFELKANLSLSYLNESINKIRKKNRISKHNCY